MFGRRSSASLHHCWPFGTMPLYVCDKGPSVLYLLVPGSTLLVVSIWTILSYRLDCTLRPH